MPALVPPHKYDANVSPYETRVEMTRLAAAGHAGVEISRMEERRGGRSYTVDLLRDYVKTHDDDLYFILGADSLRDLPSWKDPGSSLTRSNWKVRGPPVFDPTNLCICAE